MFSITAIVSLRQHKLIIQLVSQIYILHGFQMFSIRIVLRNSAAENDDLVSLSFITLV